MSARPSVVASLALLPRVVIVCVLAFVFRTVITAIDRDPFQAGARNHPGVLLLVAGPGLSPPYMRYI